jgi:hypothetical protein
MDEEFKRNPEEGKGYNKRIRKTREEMMEETRVKEEARLKALFLGESHGHYKIGTFLRIDLQMEKKYSRLLVPEYPVVLCALRL